MSSRIAKKYARALFEQVKSENVDATSIIDSSKSIEQSFSEAKIVQVFRSPIVHKNIKQELVASIVRHLKAPSALERFCIGVAHAERSGYLAEIMSEFRHLWELAQGMVDVHITSAVPLNGEQEKALLAMIEQTSRFKVKLLKNVEPSLIGGIVLTVGNSQLDLSLRKKISDFAKLAMN